MENQNNDESLCAHRHRRRKDAAAYIDPPFETYAGRHRKLLLNIILRALFELDFKWLRSKQAIEMCDLIDIPYSKIQKYMRRLLHETHN